MNSGGSEDTAESTENVKEIVSKIKSQGVFDQFRKECLADVDTKPAYQNLRQRVESYVARFLTTQKWSSKLNKNQLRNNLRKQINQSGMLNQGVERIIDQVVNPKIFQVIKPKIDDAVCNFMGIEPKQYQDQLQRRKLEQQNRQQAAQRAAQQALQPLMNIQTNASPEYNNMMMGGYGAMYQTGGMWPSPGAPFLTPPGASYPMPVAAPTSFDMQQFQYGWPTGYPETDMFGHVTPMPGMLGQPVVGQPVVGQPVIPAVSTASTAGTPSFIPHPTNIPPPNLSMPPPSVVTSSAGSVTPPPPGTVELSPHPGFSTPVKPSTTPPPPTYSPSAVSSPGALSLLANVSSYASSLDTSADVPSDAAQPPQPPPPPPPETSELPSEISTEDSDVNDMTQSFESKTGFADFTIPAASQGVTLELASDMVVNGNDESRPHFKFAWDRIVTVQEDAVSDVTISSVHTSDLSSFEEDEEEERGAGDADVKKEQEPEEGEGQKLSVEEVQEPADSDSDSITSPEVTPISSPIRPDDLPEENFTLETTDSWTPTPTPKKKKKKKEEEEATDETSVSEPTTPRKLLALSYKYSSDEEESREEKKIRIAKEKEERYQKRLQRRAELEAKKKEREEEKARVREDKKKAAGKKEEEETTDDAGKSKKEELNSSLLSQTSVTSQDESDGIHKRRRRKKTKEEMKQQLKQQKVMERRLFRQRTRNKRYTSDEYETVFTDKKQPFSSQSYVSAEQVIEETVEVEETVVYTYEDNTMNTLPKSPQTPTLDENPGTPTQDERSATPTLDEKQPPTPTMDEQPYIIELSEIPLPEQPIPIVKVAVPGAAEPFVHNTRSRTKISVDEMQSSGTSPSSDKADGRKIRKYSGNSPDDCQDSVRRSPQVVSPTARSKKELASTKSPEQSESKIKASKRYSAEDLYKPRVSHRSPIAKDTHIPPTGLRSGKQLSSPFTGSSETSAALKEESDYSSSGSGRKRQTDDVKVDIKKEPLDTYTSSERQESLGMSDVPVKVEPSSVTVKEEMIIVEVMSDTESSNSKASRRRSISESSGSSRRYHKRSRHRSRSHSRKRRCSVSSSDKSSRHGRKRSKSKRSHRRHRSDSRSLSSSGSHSRGRKFHSRKRNKSTSSSESLDEFGRVKPKDRPSSLTWAKSVSSSVDSVDEHDYRNPSRHHRRRTTDSSPESADTYRHTQRNRHRSQSRSSSDSINLKKGSIAMEPISSDSELYSDFEEHHSGDGYIRPFPDEPGNEFQTFRDLQHKTPIDQVSFGEAEKRFKRGIDRVDFGLAERHSRQQSVYEKRVQPFQAHRRGQMGQNFYTAPPGSTFQPPGSTFQPPGSTFQPPGIPFQPPGHFKRNPATEWQAPWTNKPATYTSGSDEWGSAASVVRSAPGVVRDDIKWSLSGRESSESPMKQATTPETDYRRTPVKRRLSSDGSLSPSPDRSRHSQASVGSRGISPSSRQRASPPHLKNIPAPVVPERIRSNESRGSLSSGEIVDNSSDEQEDRSVPLPLLSLELEPVSPDTPPELAHSRSATPLSAASPPPPRRRLSTSSVSSSGSLSSSLHSRRHSASPPPRKYRRLSSSTQHSSDNVHSPPSRRRSQEYKTHSHSSSSRQRSRSTLPREESPPRTGSLSTHSRKQYPSQYSPTQSSSSRISSSPSGRKHKRRRSSSQKLPPQDQSSSLAHYAYDSSQSKQSPPPMSHRNLYSPIDDTESLPSPSEKTDQFAQDFVSHTNPYSPIGDAESLPSPSAEKDYLSHASYLDDVSPESEGEITTDEKPEPLPNDDILPEEIDTTTTTIPSVIETALELTHDSEETIRETHKLTDSPSIQKLSLEQSTDQPHEDEEGLYQSETELEMSSYSQEKEHIQKGMDISEQRLLPEMSSYSQEKEKIHKDVSEQGLSSEEKRSKELSYSEEQFEIVHQEEIVKEASLPHEPSKEEICENISKELSPHPPGEELNSPTLEKLSHSETDENTGEPFPLNPVKESQESSENIEKELDKQLSAVTEELTSQPSATEIKEKSLQLSEESSKTQSLSSPEEKSKSSPQPPLEEMVTEQSLLQSEEMPKEQPSSSEVLKQLPISDEPSKGPASPLVNVCEPLPSTDKQSNESSSSVCEPLQGEKETNKESYSSPSAEVCETLPIIGETSKEPFHASFEVSKQLSTVDELSHEQSTSYSVEVHETLPTIDESSIELSRSPSVEVTKQFPIVEESSEAYTSPSIVATKQSPIVDEPSKEKSPSPSVEVTEQFPVVDESSKEQSPSPSVEVTKQFPIVEESSKEQSRSPSVEVTKQFPIVEESSEGYTSPSIVATKQSPIVDEPSEKQSPSPSVEVTDQSPLVDESSKGQSPSPSVEAIKRLPIVEKSSEGYTSPSVEVYKQSPIVVDETSKEQSPVLETLHCTDEIFKETLPSADGKSKKIPSTTLDVSETEVCKTSYSADTSKEISPIELSKQLSEESSPSVEVCKTLNPADEISKLSSSLPAEKCEMLTGQDESSPSLEMCKSVSHSEDQTSKEISVSHSDEQVICESKSKDSPPMLTESKSKDSPPMLTESKSKDAPPMLTESKSTPPMLTESKSKDAPPMLTESKSKDSPPMLTESKSKDSPPMLTESKSKDSPPMLTESKSKDSPPMLTESKSKDSPPMLTESKSKDAPPMLTESKSKDSHSMLTESKSKDAPPMLTESKSKDAPPMLTESKSKDAPPMLTESKSKDAPPMLTESKSKDAPPMLTESKSKDSHSMLTESKSKDAPPMLTESKSKDAPPMLTESKSKDAPPMLTESKSKDAPPMLTESKSKDAPPMLTAVCEKSSEKEEKITFIMEKKTEDSSPESSPDKTKSSVTESSQAATTLQHRSQKSHKRPTPDTSVQMSPPPSIFGSSPPDTPSPPHLKRQDLLDKEFKKTKRQKVHLSPDQASVESGSDQSPPSLSLATMSRRRRASGPSIQRESAAEDTSVTSQASASTETGRGTVVRSSRRSSTSDIDVVHTSTGGSSRDLGRGKRHRKSPDRLSPSRQQTSPQSAKERKEKGSASVGRETRKQKQAALLSMARETRSTRSTTAPSSGRETRSKRDKSPPAKRVKR